jgi:hypothetical protein
MLSNIIKLHMIVPKYNNNEVLNENISGMMLINSLKLNLAIPHVEEKGSVPYMQSMYTGCGDRTPLNVKLSNTCRCEVSLTPWLH